MNKKLTFKEWESEVGFLSIKIARTMKISLFFLFISIGFINAGKSYAQKTEITVTISNKRISDVLDAIEHQTDFTFIYDAMVVNTERKVSVDVKQKNIFDLLGQLFSGTDIAYTVVNKKIILNKEKEINLLQQQGKKITGVIVDAIGEPVIGANITVKGTTIGIISDIEGKFTLEVPDNAILNISYIGYITQEISVESKSYFDIILKEDVQGLEEIVVVGYGTARKKDISGSVVRADLSTLKESPNISLGSSLQGTVPGLNVGAVTTAGSDPDMSIRGRTSISGSNSPLIVLDGIIYRGSLVDINANDIESIDVLKDASAAAIYGSQASSGVLLITSKSVKAMSKPIIEYSGSISIQELSNNDMIPQGRTGFLQKIADRYISESRIGDDLLSPNPDWDVTSHLMDANAVNGYLNNTETNWWDMLTNKTPYIQMHNISVRGRSELSNYFLSMGYTDQENLIINDTYQRYNVRLNLDTKITNWLKLGTESFFTMSDFSGVSPSISSLIELPPVVAVTDVESGDYVTYPYKGVLNPMLEIEQDNVNKRYNIFANFHIDVDIPFIKGLSYRLNFSQNLINGKSYNFNPYGSNLTGSGSKSNSSQYNWTIDNILTYKRLFGKHDVNATLLYGAEKRQYESTGASGTKYDNDVLGYNNLGAADAELQVISSSAWEETSLYSMVRLGYTYNDRYIFTGTIRRDGFSGFGSNNKFAYFPSAAVAWRLSEEDFIKKYSWINNLKLRLSYGLNGNRTISRYQTLATMGFGDSYLYGDGGSAEKGLYISAMANNDLKWETTKTFNIGLDFSFLNGRIFGSFEHYNSKTYDLLYNINIPYMNNNISSIASNIGKLSNYGNELNITGVPVKTKDFSWNITFNYSLNRNKVESILGIDADKDGKEDDLISSNIFIGHPYGVHYSYNQIGMWQIADYNAGNIPDGYTYGTYKIEDIDGDGKITAANDRKIIGYSDPSYRFSIQNILRYKDFEFKFFINSIQGGKDYYYGQPGSSLANPDNIYQVNLFKFDYWTPENPNARYRQIGFFPSSIGYEYSPFIQRSFVRLQDVTLSYNVPTKFLKKFQINHFKVYVTGKNLLTFSDWDGWDPETGTGLTSGAYPLMRSYSFGINFDF